MSLSSYLCIYRVNQDRCKHCDVNRRKFSQLAKAVHQCGTYGNIVLLLFTFLKIPFNFAIYIPTDTVANSSLEAEDYLLAQIRSILDTVRQIANESELMEDKTVRPKFNNQLKVPGITPLR